jgi:hypothetical protein
LVVVVAAVVGAAEVRTCDASAHSNAFYLYRSRS